MLDRATSGLPHRHHAMDDKLETTSGDTALDLVPTGLDTIDTILKEPAHVLEEAEAGFQELDPREKVQHEMTLDIVRLLEHVESRVWLTSTRE